MSIEKDLSRIADALEKLVAIGELQTTGKVVVVPEAPKKQKAEKAAPAAAPAAAPMNNDDIIPGQDDAPVAASPVAPEVEVNTIACVGINDVTQLRAFTQKALDAADKEAKKAPQGDKRGRLVNELVTYIKGEVCAKYSPTDPKLIKIPAEHTGKAAQMIFDWCFKNKILLG